MRGGAGGAPASKPTSLRPRRLREPAAERAPPRAAQPDGGSPPGARQARSEPLPTGGDHAAAAAHGYGAIGADDDVAPLLVIVAARGRRVGADDAPDEVDGVRREHAPRGQERWRVRGV